MLGKQACLCRGRVEEFLWKFPLNCFRNYWLEQAEYDFCPEDYFKKEINLQASSLRARYFFIAKQEKKSYSFGLKCAVSVGFVCSCVSAIVATTSVMCHWLEPPMLMFFEVQQFLFLFLIIIVTASLMITSCWIFL